MRLIDADGVIEEIKRNKLLAREPAAERCMEIIKNATTYVEPPSYDADKVVEKLENKTFSAEVYNDDFNGVQIDNLLCMGDVYEIVKGGGVDE